MSRPPPSTRAPSGPTDRVVVSNSRGQQRIIGDPFAAREDGRPTHQLNAYGHSVTAQGTTSGTLLSRQQQEQLQSQEAAGMLLDALQKYGPAPGARAMLDWERQSALNALDTGVYVTWRSRKGNDCTRVGPQSLCFCGHLYAQHGGPRNDGWKKNRMACDHPGGCKCAHFSFIPQRPEECGEWWLPRRKDFDVRTYTAKCKCHHGHRDHAAGPGLHKCRACSGCTAWTSAFLCVVCDCHSEEHETVWETEQERISAGKPVGREYLPFAEAPEIGRLVFQRKKADLEQRPGEPPMGGGAGGSAGARPRVKPAVKKAISASAATGSGPAAARAASSSSAAASSSSAAASPSSSSSPSTSRPAAHSTRPPLEDRFARQSLREDDAQQQQPQDDYEDDDPFAAHAQPAPSARRASPAASAAPASRSSASSTSTSSRLSASPAARAPAAAAGPRARTAAPSPPVHSSSAAAARAARLQFEADLATNVKQASSGFKAVFD